VLSFNIIRLTGNAYKPDMGSVSQNTSLAFTDITLSTNFAAHSICVTRLWETQSVFSADLFTFIWHWNSHCIQTFTDFVSKKHF